MFTFQHTCPTALRSIPDCVFGRHDSFAVIHPTLDEFSRARGRPKHMNAYIDVRSMSTGACMCGPIPYAQELVGYEFCIGCRDASIVFADRNAHRFVEVGVLGADRGRTRVIGKYAAWYPRAVACSDTVIVTACDPRAAANSDELCIRVLDYASGSVLRSVACDCYCATSLCILPLSGDVAFIRRNCAVDRISIAADVDDGARVQLGWGASYDREEYRIIHAVPCPSQDAVFVVRQRVCEEVEDEANLPLEICLGCRVLPALTGQVANMGAVSDGRILIQNAQTGSVNIVRDLAMRCAWIVVCLPRVA